jgi:hypothetical protein
VIFGDSVRINTGDKADEVVLKGVCVCLRQGERFRSVTSLYTVHLEYPNFLIFHIPLM